MNADWKVEGPACWVQRANMWQDCSLTVVQRKTAFLEQSWWPDFDMFGSMPWCWFPWHKLLPRLTPKNCYKVYRFAYRGNFTTVACLCGHQCFSVIAQATQDSPKASPRVIFKRKNLIEQLKPLLEWMLYERWSRLSVQSSTCQHGPTLQSVSRAEKDSLFGTVMMAWFWHVWINAMVLVPMAQAPPKADAKELL